jgi:hypothetical protein
MRLGDLPRHGQADPGPHPGRLGREERVENPPPDRLRHARTTVRDLHQRLLVSVTHPDPNPAPRRDFLASASLRFSCVRSRANTKYPPTAPPSSRDGHTDALHEPLSVRIGKPPLPAHRVSRHRPIAIRTDHVERRLPDHLGHRAPHHRARVRAEEARILLVHLTGAAARRRSARPVRGCCPGRRVAGTRRHRTAPSLRSWAARTCTPPRGRS